MKRSYNNLRIIIIEKKDKKPRHRRSPQLFGLVWQLGNHWGLDLLLWIVQLQHLLHLQTAILQVGASDAKPNLGAYHHYQGRKLEAWLWSKKSRWWSSIFRDQRPWARIMSLGNQYLHEKLCEQKIYSVMPCSFWCYWKEIFLVELCKALDNRAVFM